MRATTPKRLDARSKLPCLTFFNTWRATFTTISPKKVMGPTRPVDTDTKTDTKTSIFCTSLS